MNKIYNHIICIIITYQETIISPGAKLHEAILLIERKVTDIDLTRGLENSWRIPHYSAVIMQDGFGHGRHDVLSVSAARNNKTHTIQRENKYKCIIRIFCCSRRRCKRPKCKGPFGMDLRERGSCAREVYPKLDI